MQEVLEVMGTDTVFGPRILTFGAANSLNPHERAMLMTRFVDSLKGMSRSPSPASSPRAGHSITLLPGHARAPPSSVPPALEEHLANVTLALHGGQELEAIRSMRLSRVSNAVTVAASALPPEVIRGLAEQTAFPFLFFRHLSRCYVEVRSIGQHFAAALTVERQ
jgi:hypothetical protein